MSPFIFILVTALVTAYVLQPLIFAATFGWGEPEAAYETLDYLELRGQRDAALHALRDLQGERELGKLSQEDYDTLRADYMRQAAHWMSALDSQQKGTA